MKPSSTQKATWFFALGLGLLAILVFSESLWVRPERDATLQPGGIHRSAAISPFSLDKKLWESDPKRARSILLGAEIFEQTKKLAPQYVGNTLACTQCHFNGGRQAGMLGLIGVAATYPRWDFRAQREVDLLQRIRSCFLRSENGQSPPDDARVLLALADYLRELSVGVSPASPANRENFVKIPAEQLRSIAELSPERGRQLYARHCASCHGQSGAGDGWSPPLWGKNSFNDGSGLARVYTLASYLSDSMPLSDPEVLSPSQAQDLAAYIDAQERPVFAEKDQDFPDGKIPVDAVYYPRLYPENPLRKMLEEKK